MSKGKKINLNELSEKITRFNDSQKTKDPNAGYGTLIKNLPKDIKDHLFKALDLTLTQNLAARDNGEMFTSLEKIFEINEETDRVSFMEDMITKKVSSIYFSRGEDENAKAFSLNTN